MSIFARFAQGLRAAAFAATAMVLVAGAPDRANATTVAMGDFDAYAVDYIFFTFGGGDLTIDVTGPYDPMISLFTDDGSPIGNLTGSLLATDDDGGPGIDSRLTLSGLLGGDFVLAVGTNYLTETEARSGFASTPDTAQSYTATFSQDITVAAVPLPAGGLLLLASLSGFAALRRRKG